MYSDDHRVLLNHFPKEMLPKEYGGDEISLEDLSGKCTTIAIVISFATSNLISTFSHYLLL